MLEDIGNVIFKLRTEVFKENARDFSARCGISKSCLLSIEQGITIHPTNETISKIENGTDISFEEFRIDPKIKIDKSKKRQRFDMVLKKEKKPIIDGIRSLEILATCEVMDINIEQLENTKERVNKELNEVIGIIKKKHKKKNRKNLSFEYIDKLYKASTPKNEREVMKDE